MICLSPRSSATQKWRRVRAFGTRNYDPPLNSMRCQLEALGRVVTAIEEVRKEILDPTA